MGPVVEHDCDRHIVRDTERQVHVGESIAGVHRERPYEGSGDDAIVFLGAVERPLTERVPLLDREHDLRA